MNVENVVIEIVALETILCLEFLKLMIVSVLFAWRN
jgi:hypothetical protein